MLAPEGLLPEVVVDAPNRVLAPMFEVDCGVFEEEIQGSALECRCQVGDLVRRGHIEAVKADARMLGRQCPQIGRGPRVAAARDDAPPARGALPDPGKAKSATAPGDKYGSHLATV